MSEEVMSWVAIGISLLAIAITAGRFFVQLRQERRRDAEVARERQRLIADAPPEARELFAAIDRGTTPQRRWRR